MRLTFQNPPVVAISLLGALAVFLGLVWLIFAPPAPPKLKVQLADARQLIEQARTDGFVEPLPYTVTIPTSASANVENRKLLFFAKILPLIVVENARIASMRDALQNEELDPSQLNALGATYRMKPETLSPQRLLKRVDVLPVSLVLAQAAIESAWGTSRFAQQGNAYFGERTYDEDTPGLSPKEADGFKVKRFETALQSVRSYIRTLNTHPAYRALRQHRAELRAENKPLSGLQFARHLKDYSEIGNAYIGLIERTIKSNQLSQFDHVSLSMP